ncbi:EF-hand domain-containing protein [Candidatus Williamhamiltonella defendens]|uniref:EF-hand domain-containing protein n=1 Tax=Candidatus Williamhamiltonella defendens TaxID=138072 RepID=A0AAC9YHG0_9ENTR|nr:hypothetical protein CJJ18_09615 [Candidatus Hamiltonella defensa]AWK17396.1 hypothetical protein CCS40_09435 [Candidatus Hamiltonella defensa]
MTLNELKEILGDYFSDDDIKKSFKEMDRNKDGHVSFHEFLKANVN